MKLLESGEMYLETIYILSKKGPVRSIDVCEYRGFSKPSVSRAVSLLKKDGYLTVEKGGALVLTEKGLGVATAIYERHTVLTEFFVKLGVDPKVAADDACKLEHGLSDETFGRLKEHIKSI